MSHTQVYRTCKRIIIYFPTINLNNHVTWVEGSTGEKMSMLRATSPTILGVGTSLSLENAAY